MDEFLLLCRMGNKRADREINNVGMLLNELDILELEALIVDEGRSVE